MSITQQSDYEAALVGGDYDKALALLREIVDEHPYEVNAYKDMHRLLVRAGDDAGIIRAFRKALAIAPEDLQLLFGLAVAYDGIGDFERAQAHYNTALAVDPNCAFIRTYRAYSLLKRGWNYRDAEANWRQGLEDYEHSAYMPPHPARRIIRTGKPMWDGQPIPGKRLYVTYEQGIGDGVWIARWFKLLKERSQATIIIECPLSLTRLYECIEGIDILVAMRPLEFGGFTCAWDEHIPMMSLLRVLGVGPHTEPMPTRYLNVDAPETFEGDGPKVGFCWYGSKAHSADHTRSLTWEQVEPLTKIPGIVPVSVQHGDTTMPNPLHGDFLATARRIAGLDLLVTIDSAVAHIAGALGVPVVMMTAEQNDWRWGPGSLEAEYCDDCQRTPWYPSMKIYRQQVQGDWGPVLDLAESRIKITREVLNRRSECTTDDHYGVVGPRQIIANSPIEEANGVAFRLSRRKDPAIETWEVGDCNCFHSPDSHRPECEIGLGKTGTDKYFRADRIRERGHNRKGSASSD